MAGILVSPGFDDAVRKRSSRYKKKGGSPSFKELLRTRCQERFKAKRGALLNQFRNLNTSDEVKDVISSIVREEAMVLSSGSESLPYQTNEMELDVHPLEDLAFTNFEEWILAEYDRLTEEQIKEDTLEQSVCPICLSAPLTDEGPYSTCKPCNSRLPALDRLKPALDSAYDIHRASQCPVLPSCFIVDHSMYLTCGDCSSIIFVIELTS